VETFTDIKLVGLDTKLTRQSPSAPGMKLVYLNLSAVPPSSWAQIFSQEREFPRHSMWRHAHVEGDHIVIDCVLDEIEKYHLKDIKEDVNNSNLKYRQLIAQREQHQQRAQAARDKEQAEVDELAKRLKFD
jgi:hypothetical protein